MQLTSDVLVTRKKPKTEYHHGNLRAALIECGLKLIQKKGIGALTLREIGKRLGVSRSAAYGHFKDKAALLSAISQAGFTEFENALEAAKKGAVGFAAQIDAIGVAYAGFANEHRAQFQVMFNERLEAGGAAASESRPAFIMIKMIEETIREAQQQGEVRQSDPSVLAHVVWALLHGATVLRTHVDPNFIRLIGEVLRFGLNDGRRGLDRDGEGTANPLRFRQDSNARHPQNAPGAVQRMTRRGPEQPPATPEAVAEREHRARVAAAQAPAPRIQRLRKR